ncbi:uncharacterized protein LOC130432045 [Triplophysa dalaica]|uniref:uncharacterized protein LOC130432045 n=1 Tax=Triplophysa dalaica TaxID=1582913 RepID=UPI0024E0357E|nr:uncharacterized protein LOC130432045 [Triplophysa dalaica]
MEDADKLCELLFLWLKKRMECADKLSALAQELENLHKGTNISQVVGSVISIFGTALATVFTAGLAAPLLAAAAATAGSVVSLTSTLVETGISISTMNTATALIIEDQKIGKNIQELLQGLRERCGGMQLWAHASGGSTSDTVECEVVTLLMGALARRNKIPVSLDMLRSFNSATFFRQEGGLNSADAHRLISKAVGLVVKLGKSGIMEVSKVSAKEMVKDIGSIGMRTAVKTGSRVLVGLGVSVYDLIVSSEELVKGNQVTEASQFLRDSAREILSAVRKLKDQLNAMHEIIQKLLRVEKLVKDLGGYSLAMNEDEQILMNYIIVTCTDSTVVSWLQQPNHQTEFLNLIRFFNVNLIGLLKDLQEHQGSHVDIVIVAHGEITDQFMPARCLAPSPIIETILYTPWNCSIDSNAVYSIAQGTIRLRDRVFQNRNNNRVQFEPNPLPNRWNCMRDSRPDIPMILLRPVVPEEEAWREFQALQSVGMELDGRVIIPYIVPQALVNAYGKIPLYVFIFAAWFILIITGTKATVHLGACLGRAGSTQRPQRWRAQYAYTNDGTFMTANVDMVNVNSVLFRALRSMFD